MPGVAAGISGPGLAGLLDVLVSRLHRSEAVDVLERG
jgi:hypothetical protein